VEDQDGLDAAVSEENSTVELRQPGAVLGASQELS